MTKSLSINTSRGILFGTPLVNEALHKDVMEAQALPAWGATGLKHTTLLACTTNCSPDYQGMDEEKVRHSQSLEFHIFCFCILGFVGPVQHPKQIRTSVNWVTGAVYFDCRCGLLQACNHPALVLGVNANTHGHHPGALMYEYDHNAWAGSWGLQEAHQQLRGGVWTHHGPQPTLHQANRYVSGTHKAHACQGCCA